MRINGQMCCRGGNKAQIGCREESQLGWDCWKPEVAWKRTRG